MAQFIILGGYGPTPSEVSHTKCVIFGLAYQNDGMPTSLQIAGRAHDEGICLRIGAALERDLEPIGRPDLP